MQFCLIFLLCINYILKIIIKKKKMAQVKKAKKESFSSSSIFMEGNFQTFFSSFSSLSSRGFFFIFSSILKSSDNSLCVCDYIYESIMYDHIRRQEMFSSLNASPADNLHFLCMRHTLAAAT